MNVQALIALTEQSKHCCTILNLYAIQCLGENVSSHIMCCNKGRSNQTILNTLQGYTNLTNQLPNKVTQLKALYSHIDT